MGTNFNSGLLINWFPVANTTVWTYHTLPCAHKTTKYVAISQVVSKPSTTTGTAVPTTVRNKTKTQIEYATYGGSDYYTLEFMTVGY